MKHIIKRKKNTRIVYVCESALCEPKRRGSLLWGGYMRTNATSSKFLRCELFQRSDSQKK